MVEDTIPGEARLALYMSARYLQELETALRLIGTPARFVRPGIDGVIVPRLCVACPDHGEPDEIICSLSQVFDGSQPAWNAPDPPWWFMWWTRHSAPHEPICQAVDMNEVARIIAARLREQTR
jgi:hypothetical protein